MNDDRYARIEAIVSHDGSGDVWALQSGMRLMFRLEAMETGAFLPNMRMEIDGVIQHGSSGAALIDVIVDSRSLALLADGVEFTLNAGPSDVVAHGMVMGFSFINDLPLGCQPGWVPGTTTDDGPPSC